MPGGTASPGHLHGACPCWGKSRIKTRIELGNRRARKRKPTSQALSWECIYDLQPSQDKLSITSFLPSPSPVPLGLATGSVTCPELAAPTHPKYVGPQGGGTALKPLAVLSFCFRKHGASPGSLLREVFLVPSSYLGGEVGRTGPSHCQLSPPFASPPTPNQDRP